MMRSCLVGLCIVMLAGCGVDGEPTPPPPKPKAETGIRVSGQARVGVSVSRDAASFWAAEPGVLATGSE